jgi:hypothetical protein
MLDIFKNRVLAFLSNPKKIDEDDINLAYDEALQIVGNKDIALFFVYDIAFYRYLLIIKSEYKDEYFDEYKIALGEVKRAKPKPDETTGEPKGFDVVVGCRSKVW